MPAKALPVELKGYRFQNKTERAYAQYLDVLRKTERIKDWAYEEVKVRVGEKRCWYTPDFVVVTADETLEFHEVKGHWRDDARVKIKSAAKQYPIFRWIAVQRKGGAWQREEF